LHNSNFNSYIKIRSVWEEEERSYGNQEGGILMIIGIVIHNIKNADSITENPI
jgi:hypothetical protein